ncbi:MAG: porin family protein [Legionella sp.]|nr:MAG: porin family protein [Legionella sp.]
MLQKPSLLCAILLSASSYSIAGDMGDKSSAPPLLHFNLGIEGGFSITGEANFYPELAASGVANPIITLPVPSNSDWNRNFGYSGVVGAFVGYQYNSNLGFQLGYRYRSDYDWRVNAAIGTDRLSYAIDDITVQSLLFDVRLTPSCNSPVIPYVQAGIGYARNQLGQMNATEFLFGETTDGFQQINGANTNNFAWDVGLGVNYAFASNLFFRLGYTFTDVGSVQTGNHQTVHISGFSNNLESTIFPFKAEHLFLHEVAVGLGWIF